MGSLRERILDALLKLDEESQETFKKFKWYLRDREYLAGFEPLTKIALQNADAEDVVDLIVESFPGKECLIMRTLLPKVSRDDLVPRFRAQQLSPVETARPSRDAFLKYASPLSLDPNTAHRRLILSEDMKVMKVTRTDQDQGYPEHPERFTIYANVLSRESLSARSYFEVEWSGGVQIAVCYKDINRKEEGLSYFGQTDKSWMLSCRGHDGYSFLHNSIETVVSGPDMTGPVATKRRNRWGVFVDHPEGLLRFYCVDVARNSMSVLYTERTTFTQPLYAGIDVRYITTEVCKIW